METKLTLQKLLVLFAVGSLAIVESGIASPVPENTAAEAEAKTLPESVATPPNHAIQSQRFFNKSEIGPESIAAELRLNESAVLEASPGSYTALVRGYDNSIGVALAEAFQLSN